MSKKKPSKTSVHCAVYDMIAGAYAWWHMHPDEGLPSMTYYDGVEYSAEGDIYTFIAHYLTGAQWGLFLCGFRDETPDPKIRTSDIVYKPEHVEKYPSYLRSYQAGQLAKLIVDGLK